MKTFSLAITAFAFGVSFSANAQSYYNARDDIKPPDKKTISVMKRCFQDGWQSNGIDMNGETTNTFCTGKVAEEMYKRFLAVGSRPGGNNGSPEQIGFWACSCVHDNKDYRCELSSIDPEKQVTPNYGDRTLSVNSFTFSCYGLMKPDKY